MGKIMFKKTSSLHSAIRENVGAEVEKGDRNPFTQISASIVGLRSSL